MSDYVGYYVIDFKMFDPFSWSFLAKLNDFNVVFQMWFELNWTVLDAVAFGLSWVSAVTYFSNTDLY